MYVPATGAIGSVRGLGVDTLMEKKAEFAARLREHQTQLFGYIYSLVRDLDDADDLFQQTSLVLWDKFELFDPSKSFVAWACGVARFEVSNFLRSRSRKRLYFTDELGMILIDAHEELEHERLEERRAALAGCMKKLRARDQQLLDDCYESFDARNTRDRPRPRPFEPEHPQTAAPHSAAQAIRVHEPIVGQEEGI